MAVGTLIRPTYFDAPPITPTKGGLLDFAPVTESIDWLEPNGLMVSYNCLSTDVVATWPCPAATLSAPTQNAATTATTGGTLAAGTYFIKVTATNARGETNASNEISRVTTGSTSTITANWTNLTGETGYKVYIGTATNAETFVASVAADVTSYTWTGSPAAGTATPPASNTAVVTVTKTFEAPSWADGFTFAVYGGLKCKPFGFDESTGLAAAVAAFQANESVAVERALMTTRFRANGSHWSAPVDLTPSSGAVKPKVGVAILESDASTKYAGVPVIHSPRLIASLLADDNAAAFQGNVLYTHLGSPIAAGGGLDNPNTGPDGNPAAADTMWLYGSGGVALARGAITTGVQLDRSTNELLVLVERAYVAAVDCYTGAVKVQVSA